MKLTTNTTARTVLISVAAGPTAAAYFVSSGLKPIWWLVWLAPLPVLFGGIQIALGRSLQQPLRTRARRIDYMEPGTPPDSHSGLDWCFDVFGDEGGIQNCATLNASARSLMSYSRAGGHILQFSPYPMKLEEEVQCCSTSPTAR